MILVTLSLYTVPNVLDNRRIHPRYIYPAPSALWQSGSFLTLERILYCLLNY